MGRARIVDALGEGFYRAIPLLDFTKIDLELLALNEAKTRYWTDLLVALQQKELIDRGVAIAAAALDAVIAQWKTAVIDKTRPAPPLTPSTPNDPATGLPWENPDRAQESDLLAAINAARAIAGSGAVSRNSTLDSVALGYLRYQSSANRTGHLDAAGRGPGFRAAIAGYGYTTIGELLSYGDLSAAAATAGWQRDDRATMTDAAAVDAGIAYLYSTDHYAAHLWCVLLASPGDPPGVVVEPNDPATKAAKSEAERLEKIATPKLDNLSPDQLGKATRDYGIAIAQQRAAEQEITRIRAAELARDQRIAVLNATKTTLSTPLDVWCIGYDESMTVNAEVDSIEFPGFFEERGTPRTSILYADSANPITVNWIERSWNLAVAGALGEPAGRLTPAEGMTDAAVFVNAALEPGHLKWRPRCRYGVITAKASTATVAFPEEPARLLLGESAMSLQRYYSYTGMTFSYPPCHGFVFNVGDDVVVLFDGPTRDQPVIIGFRREPKSCGRQGWNQL